VVEEHRGDLELVPIPHQPLADYGVLERAAKHDHAMRILRVQFLADGLSGVVGIPVQ